MSCLITGHSETTMSQILNLTTNSFLGHCHSVSAMTVAATPTLNIGLIMQPPLRRAMLLQRKNISTRHTNHAKSFCFLVHKKPTNPVQEGPPCCMSIDVNKEENSSVDVKVEEGSGSADVGGSEITTPEPANPRLGLEEKFAVLNTGKYECSSCGYIYDQDLGDQFYPIAPGLEFSKLPDDWRCPTCGAAQSYFKSKSIEVAGFAQNQQFGLGGNALTSGQKSALIYGSLLFAFTFFLLGYFLQ